MKSDLLTCGWSGSGPVSTPDLWPSAQQRHIDGLLERCTFANVDGANVDGAAAKAADDPVVCGVSGGADSTALLVLAVAAGLRAIAVHVDHQLRPQSGSEAEVVAELARLLGAGFRAAVVQVEPGPDLEARARKARLAELGPGALTGHTADDQAETLLINLLRGSGVPGLGAMRPGRQKPILALRRSDTVELCRVLGLTPIEDPSNRDPRFVRNRVRHELLPLMADISQRDPVPLLGRTADRARAMADDLAARASGLDASDTKALRAAAPEVAAEALRQWLRDSQGHPPSQSELERVMAVVNHQATATELAGGRRLSRSGGKLTLEHQKSR